MNLLYCDSGLKTSLGHHANSARQLVPAMERLGCKVSVAAYNGIEDGLADELHAGRVFRSYCYQKFNHDRVCGWLHDFNLVGQMTSEDLGGIGNDLIYWNSAQTGQLHGVLIFLHQNPTARAVLEFGTGPGLDTQIDPNNGGVLNGIYPHPFVNATATLYRYCSFLIDDNVRDRLTLCTFDSRASQLFSNVLDCPVETFPVPRNAYANPRLRGEKPDLTISFLGHQRNGDKGYQHVPTILRRVLDYSRWQKRPLRFLVHNGEPEGENGVKDIQAQVRQIASEYPSQVEVDERVADEKIWQELLDKSDLIVCPYWPERFHASYSAVACEAVANGIPLIVPANTSLADVGFNIGGCCQFNVWDANVISGSIISAVENFGNIAPVSHAGVKKWKQQHGADRTARAIVESLS